jgi:hypothetical protein
MMNRLAEIETLLSGEGGRSARVMATRASYAKARELRKEWAALNDCQLRRQGFGLAHLAQAKYPDWRDPSWCTETWPGLDHPQWFWSAHRPAMMTVEPYDDDELPALRRHVRAYGLELHTPPNVTASFHYPGRTVFAAIARAGREVRWLAEQVTYGGGLIKRKSAKP